MAVTGGSVIVEVMYLREGVVVVRVVVLVRVRYSVDVLVSSTVCVSGISVMVE